MRFRRTTRESRCSVTHKVVTCPAEFVRRLQRSLRLKHRCKTAKEARRTTMAVAEENWQTKRSTIVERTTYTFNKELLSDVKFVVPVSTFESESKRVIPAHKFLLAISSPVFYAMFYGQMAEAKDSIELPDCYEAVFISKLTCQLSSFFVQNFVRTTTTLYEQRPRCTNNVNFELRTTTTLYEQRPRCTNNVDVVRTKLSSFVTQN